MSTKPFSLQSPEQIAKDYGGNKQKIAQAAQMGLVDSTAAVLAGMFIDRMRSAQGLEQQPQQTVAQQVLSPQPQAAPPPAPPQGGAPMGMAGAPPVGGLQQRLGMATQQGGTPVPAPQAAGPGFAEGGLASLPVPDSMFDEPSGGGFNEGYANGGIVAFADGGETEDPESISTSEMLQRMFNPTTGQLREAREDTIAAGRAGRARREAEEAARAPVSMAQLQTTLAGGLTPRPVSVTPLAAPRPAAPRASVTPSAAPRVVPAGPALSASPAAPGAAQPPLPAGADVLAELQALAPQDTTMRGIMAKRYADMSSPEALAAQKKQDLWGALAQIGFGMAGSNSPYFLQAAGQAGAAALPGMQQAAQARKAQEMAGLQGQLGIENLTNQERQSLATRATELSEQRRKGLIDQQQFAEQMALKREELDMEREYKRAMAGAAGARASRSGAADEGAEFSNSLAQQLAEVNYNQAMALAPQRRAAAGDAYKRNPQVWDRAYQQSVRARALEYGAKRAAELSRGRGRRDRRDESAPSSTAADFTYVEGKGLVPTQQ